MLTPRHRHVWPNVDVPPALKMAAQQMLTPDERITWVGRPIPSVLAKRWRNTAIFGVVWTMFFLAYMVALSSHGLAVLLLTPFVIIGARMIASPGLSSASARRSVWIVTNHRAIVISQGELGVHPGFFSRRVSLQYWPDDLQEVRRVEHRHGGVDLIFRQRVHRGPDFVKRVDEGFIALGVSDDAESALAAIGARFVD